MDKVKVLKITDLERAQDEDFASEQINILQEVTNIDEDAVFDHYGNTFVVETEYVVDEEIINDAIHAGAKETEMYRTAFNEEIADDISERAEDEWFGLSEHGLAYFKDKSDAKLCEDLLEEYQ